MNEELELKAYEEWKNKSKETIINEWDVWQARVALSQPAAPEGWRLVPIEPTDAMIDATYHGQPLGDIWRDMVNAAPQPQEPQK